MMYQTPSAGRHTEISLFPSPSKSKIAVLRFATNPPPQKPLSTAKVPPVLVVPAAAWPTVPSTVKLPPDTRPPPPAITLLVMVKFPPDCAFTRELNVKQRTTDAVNHLRTVNVIVSPSSAEKRWTKNSIRLWFWQPIFLVFYTYHR